MSINTNFSCFNDSLSVDSFTENVWSLEPIVSSDQATLIFVTIMCFVFIILGIPWNLTVFFIVLKKKIYTEEAAVVLLLNLVLTNLFLSIYIIPFNLVPGITREFRFGDSDVIRCKVCQTGMIFSTLLLVILNNFALLSVDRLIYIKLAIYYYRLVNPGKMVIGVLVIWMASILIALPPVFGFGELFFSTAVGICTIKFSGFGRYTKNIYYLAVILIAILIPLLVLIGTNSWVIFIAQKHIRRVYADTKASKKQFRKSFYQDIIKRHNTIQTNFITIYAGIFITFIITWTPILIRILIGLVDEDLEFTSPVRIMGSLAYITLLSQIVVYPTLMAILMPEVRRHIVDSLRRSIKFQKTVSNCALEDQRNSTSEMSHIS